MATSRSGFRALYNNAVECSFEKARGTLVTAKVPKAMVPAGRPAAASPRQVPESGDVLGARANRPSLAWSRSLGIHASRPLRAAPGLAALKGHGSFWLAASRHRRPERYISH